MHIKHKERINIREKAPGKLIRKIYPSDEKNNSDPSKALLDAGQIAAVTSAT